MHRRALLNHQATCVAQLRGSSYCLTCHAVEHSLCIIRRLLGYSRITLDLHCIGSRSSFTDNNNKDAIPHSAAFVGMPSVAADE